MNIEIFLSTVFLPTLTASGDKFNKSTRFKSFL